MSLFKVTIPHIYRRSLYLIIALSWMSGVGFFIFNNWITIDGEFGPEKHPWQNNVLQIHGAMAFLIMVGFGVILSNHVSSAWKTHRSRGLGLSLIGLVSTQIITAYLLYYLANEDVRMVISYIHLISGLSLPVVLLIHVLYGLRRKQKAHRYRSASFSGSLPAQQKTAS